MRDRAAISIEGDYHKFDHIAYTGARNIAIFRDMKSMMRSRIARSGGMDSEIIYAIRRSRHEVVSRVCIRAIGGES